MNKKELFEKKQIEAASEQAAYHDKTKRDLMEWYYQALKDVLMVDERPESDREALTACELDMMAAAVEGSRWITGLEKKPLRNPKREKDHFEKVQNEYIKLCEKYGFRAPKYDFEKRPKGYYEDALKEHKRMLANDLTKFCGTGINRAKILSKVLEEI